ncbi:hypothetical protein VN12_26290 [Pirellula sp. SH-Sr6A]|uniref:hypothetical protein n=1 Tax=Pirellula sp. SH-Sr6A TaxID=1632865 RepID=UPI00078D53FB|nr:hypothetical protein [Pirellula sp. SH-Sr6A]AMV35629.1 hypothetical protein VN12_26290 [Pirellula sp. SH-Sr6A]
MMMNQRYFVNVSGEKVPPFAAMQLICHPKKWKEIDEAPRKSDLQKELDKLLDLKTDLEVGNMPVVYCTKPNRASQLLQDGSLVAFNGPTEVPVSGTGVCSVGAFMNKTLGTGGSGAVGFSLKAGSWGLFRGGMTYGPFRSFSTTNTKVNYNGSSQFPVMLVVPNQAQQKTLTPLGAAFSRVDGVGEFPFVGTYSPRINVGFYSEFGTIGEEYNAVDSLFYTQGESIRFEVPGSYEIQIFGTVRSYDAPSEINAISVDLGLSWNYSSMAEFIDKSGGGTRASFFIWKYIRTPDGMVRPMSVDEVEEPGNAYSWAKTSFIYEDNVNIKSGGAEMFLTQLGSPYLIMEDLRLLVRRFDPIVYGEVVFNAVRRFGWAPYQSGFSSSDFYGRVWNTPFSLGRVAIVNELPQF